MTSYMDWTPRQVDKRGICNNFTRVFQLLLLLFVCLFLITTPHKIDDLSPGGNST